MTSDHWIVRDREIPLQDRTLIMGVLNVTPDSFSDGGSFESPDAAVRHALAMIEQGADIIDIGGESSRPGSEPVSAGAEIDRIVPVIRSLSATSGIVLSVDTTKAEVAEAALAAGAHVINDISGLTFDPQMRDVVRRHRAGLVIMHMQGTPKTMQDAPHYDDVAAEVADYLRCRVEEAVDAGIPRDSLVVDPGIGFGKTIDHNVELMRRLSEISRVCGRPILIGVSRKRFIGTITGRDVQDRLAGSLAAMAYAICRGARIIRVHDVKESCDVARMMDKLTSLKGDV